MLRTARIVSILGDADNGIFQAKRVKLLFHEGYEHSAYAKKLNDTDFLIEILCATLGREMGLPIPEPVIAISIDGTEAWFGSLDAKHPDLSRRLDIEGTNILNTPKSNATLKLLSQWPQIEEAINFDEWIANADRNPGNVLFDGKESYSLIDHNQAMRLPFASHAPINNQLLNIKLAFNGDEIARQRLKNKVSVIIDGIDQALPRTIADGMSQQIDEIDNELLSNMVDFLEQRLIKLSHINQEKVPTQQMSS